MAVDFRVDLFVSLNYPRILNRVGSTGANILGCFVVTNPSGVFKREAKFKCDIFAYMLSVKTLVDVNRPKFTMSRATLRIHKKSVNRLLTSYSEHLCSHWLDQINADCKNAHMHTANY